MDVNVPRDGEKRGRSLSTIEGVPGGVSSPGTTHCVVQTTVDIRVN